MTEHETYGDLTLNADQLVTLTGMPKLRLVKRIIPLVFGSDRYIGTGNTRVFTEKDVLLSMAADTLMVGGRPNEMVASALKYLSNPSKPLQEHAFLTIDVKCNVLHTDRPEAAFDINKGEKDRKKHILVIVVLPLRPLLARVRKVLAESKQLSPKKRGRKLNTINAR